MENLALLNKDGTFNRKLSLVCIPDSYVIPEGMILSWEEAYEATSEDARAHWRNRKVPRVAHFHLGKAWAEVRIGPCNEPPKGRERISLFYSPPPPDIAIEVQGTSGKDVATLRDRILGIISGNSLWDLRNDLNPQAKLEKPSDSRKAKRPLRRGKTRRA